MEKISLKITAPQTDENYKHEQVAETNKTPTVKCSAQHKHTDILRVKYSEKARANRNAL